jgi:U3 small nucleolar RNA-associated protein 24
VISKKDNRRRENATKADDANATKSKTAGPSTELIREIPQLPSSLFFQHNEALVPPYNVLVDTNFLSHTVQRKLPLLESMMDLLYAKANPLITDCVMGELEKLGSRYRLALRIARDTRWERLKCDVRNYLSTFR